MLYLTSETELKEALPVNTNTSLQTLRPAIEAAERRWIVPSVGEAAAAALHTYYERVMLQGLVVDDPRSDVVRLLRQASVRLGWWDSFDLLAVQLSETGLQDANGDNRAYRYQAENARAALKRQGFDALNDALLLLDEAVEQVPQYRQSPYWSGNSDSLLPTSRHFHTAASGFVQPSAVLFARLRPFIDEAQRELAHWVPETLTRDIVAQVTGREELRSEHYDTANPDGGDRCGYIGWALQKHVAFKALAEGVTVINTLLGSAGLEAAMPDHGDQTTHQPADPDATEALHSQYSRMADRYLSTAVDLMRRFPQLYPDADPYGAAQARDNSPLRRDNHGKRSVFL